MSQLRVLYRELRAVLATAMVCALVLGLVFSGVAQAGGGGAAFHGAAKIGAYAHCVQHLTHSAASETRAAPSTNDKRSDRRNCVYCCLAAHAAAVLPERFPAVARPLAHVTAPTFLLPASARAPANHLTCAVNGARAPPSLLLCS